MLPDDKDAKSGAAKPMRQPLEVMGRLKDMMQRETVSDQRIEQPGAQKEALGVNVEKQCEQALIIGQQNSDQCQRLWYLWLCLSATALLFEASILVQDVSYCYGRQRI